MSTHTIKLAETEKFRIPGGRLQEHSPGNSGEEFKKELLLPALQDHPQVVVDISGVPGIPACFLEEAFGTLVSEHGFSAAELRGRLEIVSKQKELQPFILLAWKYIDEAGQTAPAYEYGMV